MDYSFSASDAFDALLYAPSHPGTLAFLSNQFNNVSNVVTETGRSFIDRGREIFNHYNGSAAINFARNIINSFKREDEVISNHITYLHNLETQQRASLMMQRWMMANPNVRKEYHQHKLDGYADTYVDMYPNASGREHYDYRRVMTGVFEVTDTDWSSTTYMDELTSDDRELTLGEKVAILDTWATTDYLLALSEEDPTSSVGGKL